MPMTPRRPAISLGRALRRAALLLPLALTAACGSLAGPTENVVPAHVGSGPSRLADIASPSPSIPPPLKVVPSSTIPVRL